MVDDLNKYIEFLDYLDGTLVTVEIISTQEPSSSKPHVPTTADTTSSTAVAAHNGPLQQICLRCYMQDGFEEVDSIPVDWAWDQVLSWFLMSVHVNLP